MSINIQARIDYWGEGFAIFDTEKVLIEAKKRFPDVVVDPTDYSQLDEERTVKFASENLKEPQKSRMIRQAQEKNKRNGPSYRFSFNSQDGKQIIGRVRRYSVSFTCENQLENETKQQIIDFLKYLNLGEISMS